MLVSTQGKTGEVLLPTRLEVEYSAVRSWGEQSLVDKASSELLDIQYGYGQCMRYLCNCRRFEGLGSTCSNCGHAYSDHY